MLRVPGGIVNLFSSCNTFCDVEALTKRGDKYRVFCYLVWILIKALSEGSPVSSSVLVR